MRRYFFFVQLPQDLSADLIAQNDHQDRGLAHAGRGGLRSLQVLNHRLMSSLPSDIQDRRTCAMLAESFLACSAMCLVNTSVFLGYRGKLQGV